MTSYRYPSQPPVPPAVPPAMKPGPGPTTVPAANVPKPGISPGPGATPVPAPAPGVVRPPIGTMPTAGPGTVQPVKPIGTMPAAGPGTVQPVKPMGSLPAAGRPTPAAASLPYDTPAPSVGLPTSRNPSRFADPRAPAQLDRPPVPGLGPQRGKPEIAGNAGTMPSTPGADRSGTPATLPIPPLPTGLPPGIRPAGPGAIITETVPNMGGGSTEGNPETGGGYPGSVASPPGTSPIDPGNDLRSQQILTEEDPRTKRYAGAADEAFDALPAGAVSDRARKLAADRYASYGDLENIDTGPSERLSQYGNLLDREVGGLAGVDRVKLAQDMLKQFREATSDDYDLELRKATEKAVATGMGRSGILRTDYGNIADRRMRLLDQQGERFLTDALHGSIDDQFRKTDALGNIEDRLSGREAGVRDETRRDRATRLSARDAADSAGERLATADEDSGYRRVGTATGMEDRARAIAGGRADELRGERGHQNSMEEKAFQRRFLQDRTERDDILTDQDRAIRLLAAGEAGNPADILADLARQGLDPALIQQLAMGLGARGGGGATAPQAGGSTPPWLDPELLGTITDTVGGMF